MKFHIGTRIYRTLNNPTSLTYHGQSGWSCFFPLYFLFTWKWTAQFFLSKVRSQGKLCLVLSVGDTPTQSVRTNNYCTKSREETSRWNSITCLQNRPPPKQSNKMIIHYWMVKIGKSCSVFNNEHKYFTSFGLFSTIACICLKNCIYFWTVDNQWEKLNYLTQ